MNEYVSDKEAGICPECGHRLVWRRAQLTDEMYRGCTNYPNCKYNTRSYSFTPKHAKHMKSKIFGPDLLWDEKNFRI